jgi:predicted peroxiredoxin
MPRDAARAAARARLHHDPVTRRAPRGGARPEVSAPGPLVLFVRGDAWEARHLAVSLALTAAALGDEVHLALFGGALRLFVGGRFDEGAPPSAAAAKVGSLAAALGEGRRDLGVRVVACDTALRLAGLDAASAVPPLDGVVSLPSLWLLARGGRSLTV